MLATFVVSVYILGFAFGPLIVAPLSEYSGRTIVYNTCNVLFLIFNIASAVAPNLASLVVFRFLCGVAGVTPTTIGSGTIADFMPAETRGKAMALWSLGPLFGPVIGPIAGGYLVEATSWRWVFWVLSIVVRLIGYIQRICYVDLVVLLGRCYVNPLLLCGPRNSRANPS
jgi:multidrug resistance protein